MGATAGAVRRIDGERAGSVLSMSSAYRQGSEKGAANSWAPSAYVLSAQTGFMSSYLELNT